MNPFVSPSGRPQQPLPKVAPTRTGDLNPAAATPPFTVDLPGLESPRDAALGQATGNQAKGAVPEWEAADGIESISLPGQEKETDMVYVRRLYKELLGRDPDPEGFAAHVLGLSKGVSRTAIREGFLKSPEYQEVQAKGGAAAVLAQNAAAAQGAAAPAAAGSAEAKPAQPAVGPVPLEGYDHNKLHNPEHRTPKYIFGRVASNHGLGQVKDHAQAEALLKKMVPELEAAGLQVLGVTRDKIQVVTELGVEMVDVVRGAGSGSPGWWWGSEGKGTPIPAGAKTMSGAPVKPVVPGGTPGAPGTTPKPPSGGPLPAGALPSLPTVPVTDEFANAPIDKSSIKASLMSAATWVKDTYPHLFTQGDDRPLAYQMMAKVIGALRAHGVDAYRIVNHSSRPVGDPGRYGSDALVVNGEVYDVYAALGEANRPQVLHHGPMSGKQSQE